jgi:hypothetical protein
VQTISQGLHTAYVRADTSSLTNWTAPKALPADVWSPKACPAGGCSGVVTGLLRYGRPANKALLDLIQRKQLEMGRWAAEPQSQTEFEDHMSSFELLRSMQ